MARRIGIEIGFYPSSVSLIEDIGNDDEYDVENRSEFIREAVAEKLNSGEYDDLLEDEEFGDINGGGDL